MIFAAKPWRFCEFAFKTQNASPSPTPSRGCGIAAAAGMHGPGKIKPAAARWDLGSKGSSITPLSRVVADSCAMTDSLVLVIGLNPVSRLTTKDGRQLTKSSAVVCDRSRPYATVTLWADRAPWVHHLRIGDVVLLTRLRHKTYQDQVVGNTTGYSKCIMVASLRPMPSSPIAPLDRWHFQRKPGMQPLAARAAALLAWGRREHGALLRFAERHYSVSASDTRATLYTRDTLHIGSSQKAFALSQAVTPDDAKPALLPILSSLRGAPRAGPCRAHFRIIRLCAGPESAAPARVTASDVVGLAYVGCTRCHARLCPDSSGVHVCSRCPKLNRAAGVCWLYQDVVATLVSADASAAAAERHHSAVLHHRELCRLLAGVSPRHFCGGLQRRAGEQGSGSNWHAKAAAAAANSLVGDSSVSFTGLLRRGTDASFEVLAIEKMHCNRLLERRKP